ncbi:hypothetical protein FACS1894121_1440 [Bacteroidia bacterium]|nr:hypothetical protein FACS1894121_1440 [Bacteroidia bacterium]
MKRIYLLLFILLGFLSGAAQNVEYGAKLDTTFMLIGDQQKLTAFVMSEQYLKVSFPDIKKQLPQGVEVIAGPLRDSTKDKSGRWQITETYVITAFDTGFYVIPEIAIALEGEDYNSVYRTESLAFAVTTYEIKSEEYFDIVLPYDASWSFAEILPYILYVLAGLALAAAVIWGIRKYKRREPLFKSEKVVIPPYIKAVSSLDQLKEEKLWQSGHVKKYYTALTETLRTYIEEELQIPALEQTSPETLNALKGNKYVALEDKERLADLFELADFVKFAKLEPLGDENAKNMSFAYEFLKNVNEKIEEEKVNIVEDV